MNAVLRPLYLYLLAFLPLIGFAQTFVDYRSFPDNGNGEKLLSDAIAAKFRQDLSSLSGNNKKYVGEIYKERYELLKKKLENKELITNEEVQQYLGQLAKEIFDSNRGKLDPAGVRIYFSRNYWPNAASMGEGTIIFNIGLFNRLQNEAQAVFVICHELAHYYLNHSNNAIRQYVETVNSAEFQSQLKSIRKSAYGQNTEVEKLALKLSFRSHRHSREFEQAADSMAIEFMKHTSFDLNEALSCLSLLDSVDKEKYQENLKLDETFNFPDYPFKKKWLVSSELVFKETEEESGRKKLLEDSLKTHPDCKRRIERIIALVKQFENSNGKRFIIDENKFRKFRDCFDYEIINYCYESGQISRSLYLVLQMLRFNPEQPYLLGMAGKCLNRIYAAQANHELGKITDLPNPSFNDQYNTLLRFLQNVRLQELGAVAYYFLKQHQATGKASEEFIGALITSKDNFQKPAEKQEWITYYQSHFSNRKYNF